MRIQFVLALLITASSIKADDEREKRFNAFMEAAERQQNFEKLASVRKFDEESKLWQTELDEKPKFNNDDLTMLAPSDNDMDAQKICIYGIRLYFGAGITQDRQAAVKLFKKAAKQKNGKACKCLSECYYLGSGVPRDMVMGYRLWLEAARIGYIPAMLSIGKHFEIREKI